MSEFVQVLKYKNRHNTKSTITEKLKIGKQKKLKNPFQNIAHLVSQHKKKLENSEQNRP